MSEYPMAGVKIGPAWQVAWDTMADGTWQMHDDLLKVMCERGPIAERTARNLLASARAGGLIEVRYKKYGGVKYRRTHSYRRCDKVYPIHGY